MPDVAIPKEMQPPKGIPPQEHFLATLGRHVAFGASE